MSFEWRRFLHLAMELADDVTDGDALAARSRTAISRAYYAAFCSARDHLSEDLGYDVPTQGVHEYVRRQFDGLKRWRDEYKVISTYLRRLHRKRILADYDAHWGDDVADAAQTAVADGGRVLRCLDVVRPE